MEQVFKDKLIKVIESVRWNQKKLAEELGISPAHVSRILKGTHEPSKALAKQLEYLINAHTISPSEATTDQWKEIAAISKAKHEALTSFRDPQPDYPENRYIRRVVVIMEDLDESGQHDIMCYAEKEHERHELKRLVSEQAKEETGETPAGEQKRSSAVAEKPKRSTKHGSTTIST